MTFTEKFVMAKTMAEQQIKGQFQTSEELMNIYLRGEDELYAHIKNDIIKKMLGAFFDSNFWKALRDLEIGGGGGLWTEFFANKGCEVVSVDINERILKANQEHHPKAKFIHADAATLKLDRKFDLVFAKDVIEHIREDERFLENMNCHLKNGGLILINTQNSWSFNYLVQGGYHFLKNDKSWCGWDASHVRFYNLNSLKKKLKKAGFKPLKWFGSYYFPYRIIKDRFGVNETFLKPFCLAELIGLYDKTPFNAIGWGLGVIAKKSNNKL